MTTTTTTTKKKLTAREVEHLKPKGERYAVQVDFTIPGLELRVSPDGRRIWSLRYRIFKKQRRIRLGRYPAMSLADARLKANKALRQVDDDIDPLEERQKTKTAAVQARARTIDALATAYLAHVKARNRTWTTDESYIRREILPRWSGRPLESITRGEIGDFLQAICDRPAPIEANRVQSLLSTMFSFALQRPVPWVAGHPMSKLPMLGVEFDDRPDPGPKAYDAAELRTIWTNVETVSIPARAQIRVQLFTATRPGEVAGMRWSEIDVDTGWWTIPASRMKAKKAHRVFLVDTARAELERVPRVDGADRVFSATCRSARSKVNKKIFANVPPRRLPRHRLRNTAASLMSLAGVSDEHVSHVLAHATGSKVTRSYISNKYDPEKRAALLRLEQQILTIVEGQEATATRKVVSIGGARDLRS